MVVLHWLKGNSTYKHLIQNQIDHINSKAQLMKTQQTLVQEGVTKTSHPKSG